MDEHNKIQGHPMPPAASVENTGGALSGRRLTHPLTALFVLIILAVVIYSNTFSVTFHFDDGINIVDNPWIKDLTSFLYLSGSRYVGFLTFALNYRFGGLSVFGYHLVNLLIHITNGVLVYALVLLLFRAAPTPPASRPSPVHAIALSAALLFIAHPIQTQAVTYIVQRFASLAALFYLLTVLCYLKWRLSPSDSKRRHLWYAAAFITTILGMKTKETTFTLPFMLLLVEAVFFGPPTRKQWLGLIPFFLTLPIIPLSRPGALGEGEAGLARVTMDIGRPDYLFTQFRVILTYLRLLVLPVNQNLDYDYPVYHSLFDPPVFFSFLFLSALFAAAVYLLWFSRRAAADPRLRLIGFGVLWFFITLSIESSIIPIRDVIFEHRLYLPSAGLFLAIGTAALGYADRSRVWAGMGIGLVVLLFSGLTYERNLVWKDELSLWTDVVQKSPNKARPYLSLGAAYADQGMPDKAIQAYKTALTLKPDYAEVHNNLGNIFKDRGQLDEALQEYQTALTLKPKYAEAHNNLGIIYKERGRLDESLQEYKTALILKPEYAQTHNNMGVVYSEQGHLDEAIREYRAAVTQAPNYADPHYNLGNLYAGQGRLEEAIQEYQAAIALNSHYAEAYNNLGLAYYRTKQLPEALEAFRKLVQLKPKDPLAHSNLGNIYKVMARPEEAIQEYQAALAIQPNYLPARIALGMSNYERGDLEGAIREFQIVIQLKPDLPEAHYYLGKAFSQSGQKQEAARAFNRALQIRPNYEDARQALKALSP